MKFFSVLVIFFVIKQFVSYDSSHLEKVYSERKFKNIHLGTFKELEELFKDISKNKTHLYLSIEHLLYLTENEIITPEQTKQIWEIVNEVKPEPFRKQIYEKINNNKISDKIEINGNGKILRKEINDYTTFTFIEEFIKEIKKNLNFNQIMMVTILALLIIGFLIFIVALNLYRSERYVALSFILMMVLYNALGLGINLQIHLRSFFLPGLIINFCFFIYNAILHVFLIKLNFQKKIIKFKEILNVDSFFMGKLIQFTLSSVFFYILMFYFDSYLAQIPFYFSFFVILFLIAQYYEPFMSKYLWPSWMSFFSFFSFLMIIYLCESEEKSFVLFKEGLLFERNYNESEIGFQYFGFVFGYIILNFVFPLYVFFQQKRMYNNYKANDFSLNSLYSNLKIEMNQDQQHISFESFSFHISALVSFFLLFLGLKLKISILILMCLYSLKSYICLIIKYNHLFWRVMFYFISFLISNSVYLMGKIEDKYSNSVIFFDIFLYIL